MTGVAASLDSTAADRPVFRCGCWPKAEEEEETGFVRCCGCWPKEEEEEETGFVRCCGCWPKDEGTGFEAKTGRGTALLDDEKEEGEAEKDRLEAVVDGWRVPGRC